MQKGRPRLEWSDLRFFLAVARAGTVTAAAKHLRVDHATVIRRIERLERGSPNNLFLKRRSGYQLTEAGQTLLGAAEAAETAIIAAEDSLGTGGSSLIGPVRIGAPDGLGTSYLPGVLGALAELHPAIELQLVATARLLSLSRREADIAISVAVPETGRLLARKLTDYNLGLYAAPSYLASRPTIRGRDDLLAHRFIGYIDELLFTPELDYLHLVHPGIAAKFKSGNLVAQMNAAGCGLGIAVLPHFMTAATNTLERVLPGEFAIKRSFWLLTHSDTTRLARIRTTVDFLVQAVKSDKDLFEGT